MSPGRENCGRVGLSRPCRALTVPAVRPPAATPWALGAATARRRARLLVYGATAAAVATAVLLALLTAALVTGRGGGSAAGDGVAAVGPARPSGRRPLV